jgi:multidrug transporter EmrE-like cation transporter
MSFVYLACAIVFTALAQVSFKLYSRRHNLSYLVLTIGLFCVVPFMNYLALRDLSMGVVYMSTGLTYVLIMFFSKYILYEPVGRQHVYAVTLIVSGVLVFNI